jgi:lipopolysaccharide biosynthesis glycosyltransferase
VRDAVMEIVCASDGNYLPHVATMICSALANNNIKAVHFLYGSVSDAERAVLSRMVERYGSEFHCYDMDRANISDLPVNKWATPAVYYRVLASEVLPKSVKKVLYLDADIVVRRSLATLWQVDVSAVALAAVADHDDAGWQGLGFAREAGYFNSGVMLLNLDYWRQHALAEKVLKFARDNPEKVRFWDQDALNATLVGRWMELPPCWNAQADGRTWEAWLAAAKPGTGENPAVVHFTCIDGLKPWHWALRHPFKRDYRAYRRKTPWRRYVEIGRPPLAQRMTLSARDLVRSALPASARRWLRFRLQRSTA